MPPPSPRFYAPLQRRSSPTRLHGATSQKDSIFISTVALRVCQVRLETGSTHETSVNFYETTQHNTGRRGSVVNTPASYSGGPEFKFRSGDRLT
jgi:hypothetical protein